MATMTPRVEEYRTKGEQLVARVRELIREGNVRRIIIKNDEGRTLIEIPLTIGVVGALLLPAWAALGAIAALVTDCSIEVEREAETGPSVSGPALQGAEEAHPHVAHASREEAFLAVPEDEYNPDEEC
jgi:hypothetical protein